MGLKTFLIFVLVNITCAWSGKLFFEPKENSLHAKNETEPVHWVLLVAGSSDYYNYRHQADVCHAYQLVRKHGVPPERIVTMMVDDIAYSSENPVPGKIFNKPGGPDVYEGVIIDYKGNDVNPKNFLSVLKGDEEAMANKGSGKVIKSGPNDHVFVNFVDHGGDGVLCFPSDDLHAEEFMEVLKDMYKQKKFGQMVLYIEACESGSMFENLLPDNMNIYVTTAANAHESSYACYYDKKLQTYLGDVYSVNWMEDSDQENLNLETLHKQYLIVKKNTNTSHVCEFGDKKITDESLDNFQGELGFHVEKPVNGLRSRPIVDDAVPSEDVPLAILYRTLESTTDADKEREIKQKIRDLIKEKDNIEETMKKIVRKVSEATSQHFHELYEANRTLTSYGCYKTAARSYDKHCFDISTNGYARKSLKKLVNMCEESIPEHVITEAILSVCKS